MMIYKPTFRPSIIFAEVANIEVTVPPSTITSTESIPSDTTAIDEKTNLAGLHKN